MTEKEPILKPGEKQETKEKEPEMRLKFFFSPHLKKEDFAKLEQEFDDCDVYVPESFNHKPETTERFRKLSRGEGPSPEELVQQIKLESPGLIEVPEVEKKLWEIIYDSQKPIYLVDIPESHELISKNKQALRFDSFAFLKFLTGKFSDALVDREESIKLFPQIQTEREEYIKENIEKLKSRILEDYPKLKNNKEIKALVSLGAGHTSLYHQFKKEKKLSVQQVFSSLPLIFSISAELRRRKFFFPEKEIDKEKLAQSFIEEIVGLTLKENKNIKNSDELYKVAGYLTAKFKEKDVANFSKMFSKKHSMILPTFLFVLILSKQKWKELFEPPLKEFGVQFPKTREEVEKIIKKAEKKG